MVDQPASVARIPRHARTVLLIWLAATAVALPTNAKHALKVQVIGQQWNWTYRFPAFGGLETDHLDLPAGTLIEFHVTSLDVTHSFWAYELGVKADAVPGADNVAFVHTGK